jgi:competence ComEA-like helix-hairpin-helix protein
MKNIFGDYFYFTASERKVITIVVSSVILLRLLPLTFPLLFSKNEVFSFPAMPQFALSHQAHQTKLSEEREIREFPFNPNLATREDFANLGLSERVINTIYNFKNKGGKFYKAEDFQKIWGLPSSEYQRLLPYIVIENNFANSTNNNQNNIAEPIVAAELFIFSPNLASLEDLSKLGIPLKVAQRIVNYRSKGGVFRRKEDLQKIYGFSPDLYAKLEPFIDLGSNPSSTPSNAIVSTPSNITIQAATASTYTMPTELPNNYSNIASTSNFYSKKNFSGNIDINQASAEQWQQLPGIGAGYANKIINFREKLGGFYSTEQVKETYGLPDSTFQKIKVYLKPSSILRTININTVTQEELSKHPYCKTSHAKLIINYRETHGKFANIDALKKVYGIQDILPKLQSYISF